MSQIQNLVTPQYKILFHFHCFDVKTYQIYTDNLGEFSQGDKMKCKGYRDNMKVKMIIDCTNY